MDMYVFLIHTRILPQHIFMYIYTYIYKTYMCMSMYEYRQHFFVNSYLIINIYLIHT